MKITIHLDLNPVAQEDFLLHGTPSNSVAEKDVYALLAELNSLESFESDKSGQDDKIDN